MAEEKKIITHTYRSGLRLVRLPMPGVKTVTVLVLVGVGSRYEIKTQAGLSHFVEHMVFKGTKKRPSAQVIARELDGMGSESNAHTGYEATGYYIKAAADHLDQALNILGDITLNSAFPQVEIDKERGVILEEINMYEDLPMRKVYDVYSDLMYRGGGMARPIIGYRQTVSKMMRKDMLSHIGQWLKGENVVVAIAGDETVVGQAAGVDLVKKVGESFASIKSGEVGEKEKGEKPVTGLRVRVERKKLEQSHLVMGVRGLPRGHNDRYTIGLLAVILGGNMSSRLFTEIREKRGWAYYIGAGVNGHIGVGDFMVRAGLVKNKTLEAVELIWQEMTKASRIKAEELARAKDYVKGKLYLGLEDSQQMAELAADDWLLEGRVRTVTEMVAGIDRVEMGEITELAGQIFRPDKLVVAMMGDSVEEVEIKRKLSV